MKQHITTKQLNELSEKGKGRLDVFLRKIWGITNPLYEIEIGHKQLSIGQLIGFLDEDGRKEYKDGGTINRDCGQAIINDFVGIGWDEGELCDALWEAVKEVLEK